MQAALTGVELGYFNAGFLCNEIKELNDNNSLDCIEQLLNRYLIVHGDNRNINSYALLTVAEYNQGVKRNISRTIELNIQLYKNGDAQVKKLYLNI